MKNQTDAISSSSGEMALHPEDLSSAEIFVELIRRFLPNEPFHEYLWAEWQKHGESILADLSLDLYTDLLSHFYVVYKPSNTVSLFKQPVIEHPQWQVDLLNKHIQAHLEYEKVRSDVYNNMYGWFETSWLLFDQLENSFPDDLNPGKVIAQYLDKIFPKELFDVFPHLLNTAQPNASVVYGSNLHHLITEMGEALVSKCDFEPTLKGGFALVVESFLNPKAFIDFSEISIDDVVKAASLAPNRLLLLWLRDWLLCEESDGYLSPHLSEGALSILLKKITLDKNEECCGKLWITTDLLGQLIFKLKREESPKTIGGKTKERFVDLFRQYTTFRRQTLCGVSPVDHQTAQDFFELSQRYNIEIQDIDMTFVLGEGSFDFGGLYLKPENNEDPFWSFEEKQELYILLFRKALEDGLPALGNALLSLYLFGRAIYLQGRLPLGPPLSDAIRDGMELPGKKILEHTLRTIISESEKAFPSDPLAKLSRQFLKEYLPQRASISTIGGAPNSKKNSDSTFQDLEGFLVRQLGDQRWQKLSIQSRESLVTVEIMWQKTNSEFGWGIKDFSGMVMPCCKAVENELAERLAEFYCNNRYRTWASETFKKECPEKPTGGWLVQLLRHYERMPVELRDALDDLPIRTHHNAELLGNLQKLMQARNEAAHKEQFNMAKFTAFRKLFYQDGLLHQFIDSLL